ncbi:MAG TPA: M20 family metallopeptidase [Vicinamibacterales bacterium]|nr:M20 family metallopeptidase [Vicinamibacterales bacterium]
MRDLLTFCENEQPWLRAAIESLVRIESPTPDKRAVDACGARVAELMREMGGRVDIIEQPEAGNHVRGVFGSGPARVLLIGHFDTVWDAGTIERMPLTEKGGTLSGPGIFDMKGGLAIALQAIRALRHAGWPGGLEVVCLWTSDEETGSATSRALIEREAQASKAVLVFEPGLSNGEVKTARKGVGHFVVTVTGVSSHSGIDPDAGASAVHALARVITSLEALNDLPRGISVNAGVIRGGTRSNVVAETAEAEVDVRVARAEDAPAVTRALQALAVEDPRIQVRVSGAINRPPFERTEGVAALYGTARDVARELGFDLGEGATGGASDGNFTGALGVPTLDGLGAIGGGAHAIDEHIVTAMLPRRAALAAGLLRRLA